MNLSPIERLLLWYVREVRDHRGKWRIAKIISDRIRLEGPLLERRSGLWWSLNPSDYGENKLFWYGALDKWELFHLTRLVPQPRIIFDVGTNFGYYSLVLARMFPDAVVHSFEPNPLTKDRLLRNIELNNFSRIEVHGCALGDTEGFVSMDEPEGNSGAARVIPGGSIPVLTLDGFCAERGIEQLDLMKVDIEGSEEQFLRGGLQTLRRLRPTLLIELNPPVLQRMGSSVEGVVSALRDLDYDVLDIQRKKLIRFAGVPDGQLSNVICIPHEKLAT